MWFNCIYGFNNPFMNFFMPFMNFNYMPFNNFTPFNNIMRMNYTNPYFIMPGNNISIFHEKKPSVDNLENRLALISSQKTEVSEKRESNLKTENKKAGYFTVFLDLEIRPNLLPKIFLNN